MKNREVELAAFLQKPKQKRNLEILLKYLIELNECDISEFLKWQALSASAFIEQEDITNKSKSRLADTTMELTGRVIEVNYWFDNCERDMERDPERYMEKLKGMKS